LPLAVDSVDFLPTPSVHLRPAATPQPVASRQQYGYACLEPNNPLEYPRIALSIGKNFYPLAALKGFSKLENAFSKAEGFRPTVKKGTPTTGALILLALVAIILLGYGVS